MHEDLIKALQAQFTSVLQELQVLGRKLDLIEYRLKPPEVNNIRPYSLPTSGKWYAFSCPRPIKVFYVKSRTANANLLVAFTITDNIQEELPNQGYDSIPSGTRQEYKSSPKVIQLQSDTTNTIVEVEYWI